MPDPTDSSLRPISSKLLSSVPELRHGFFTRQGGLSRSLFSSLNFAWGKGDRPRDVEKNYTLVSNWFGIAPTHLLYGRQVHADRVLYLDEPFDLYSRPDCDALVTDQKDLAIGVITADCVPLLLCDPVRKTIAAVHSGWKGTVLNITRKTLQMMSLQGSLPADILAVIGPCIHQQSYEVSTDVRTQFLETSRDYRPFFAPSPQEKHFMCDLPGLVAFQLRQEGVHQVEQIPLDTYQEEALFYSCRRAAHRQEPTFGCFLSAIMLK